MSFRIPRRVAFITSVSLTASIVAAAGAGAQGVPSGKPAAELPPVEIETSEPTPASAPKKAPVKTASPAPAKAKAKPAPAAAAAAMPPLAPDTPELPPAADPNAAVPPGTRSGSLGVATAAEARAEIDRTPGGVAVVPAEAYQDSTPAVTLKDALDYVPGVFVQTKWGEDSRLSIRGSGLSRNFHLRGVQLFMNGIPINTADGFGDFQEIDPSAYRYIEVFKGGNALRFGANSLGGAINFVMPTGYDSDLVAARLDVGSFGLVKTSVSSGAVSGVTDYALTATWQEHDGFRDHSDGESLRGSGNIGFKITPDAETRFFVNANTIEQRIPGAVTRHSALSDPTAAAGINVLNDWQRNIDSLRVANQTTVRLAPGTLVEAGAFYFDRHLMHPIFRWLDYAYDDYGGYARLWDESTIAGYRNLLVAGANIHNGTVDARQFGIGPGAQKLGLLSQTDDRSENYSVYAENSFFFLQDVALVAGFQYLHAKRQRDVLFTSVGDLPGEETFDIVSPKVGLIWDVNPAAQVFANISKSAEVPSFGENTVGSIPFAAVEQEAITYEIGTRGRIADLHWDLALYRAEIDNELQCLTIVSPFFTNQCAVTNADSTVHQGIELGLSAAVLPRVFESVGAPDQLWLTGAYTLNDFFFDDDPAWGDNELPGVPRHVLKAELIYKHPSGAFAGPTVEWVPEAFYVDNANTLATEGYAIWGMKLGYEGKTFTAYLEGRNLSDEAYIASASVSGDLNGVDGSYFEPGTGRAVYGGLQVRW